MKRASFVLALVSIVSMGILPACKHSGGNSSADDGITPPHDVFPPEITVSPPEQTVEQGGTARLTATAQPGENDSGTISYQWFKTGRDGKNGTAIPAETSPSFTPTTSVVGTQYYICQAASSTDPETLTAKSNVASVTVTKKSSGGDTTEPPVQETPGGGNIDFDFGTYSTGGSK
ncbi:MAG: immunoglobulin domain-containing protein [Treponemataceae bacterium]|nr:immunoglobulin domain-containing protein [Treponemataceae bacterium]